MARSDLKSKPEWKHQQELREQRKKRHSNPPPTREADPLDMTPRPLRLVIRDRNIDNLRLCYDRLGEPPIPNYVRKFKYHDPRQKAVMMGEILIPDLPFALHSQFLSILGAGGRGWVQGSLKPEEIKNG